MKAAPELLLLSLTDVFRILGRLNATNMIRAGWLKPCAYRQTAKGEKPIYHIRDVEACSARVYDGEYPTTQPEKKCPTAEQTGLRTV